MNRVWVIVTILAVQVLSAVFFVSDILSAYMGLWTEPLPWDVREIGNAIDKFPTALIEELERYPSGR